MSFKTGLVLFLFATAAFAAGPYETDRAITLKYHENSIGPWTSGVAFSRDGAHLAAAGASQDIRVWSVPEGKLEGSLDENSGGGTLITAMGDSKSFLVASASRWKITFWNWESGEKRTLDAFRSLSAFAPTSKEAGIHSIFSTLQVSPKGKLFLSASQRGSGIVVWNLETGNPVTFINAKATSAVFSPDGKSIIAGTAGLDVYDLEGNLERRLLVAKPEALPEIFYDQIVAAADGSTVAVGSGFDGFRDAVVDVVDAKTGRVSSHFELGKVSLPFNQGLSLAGDGKRLLVSKGDRADLYDLRSQTIVQSWKERLTSSTQEVGVTLLSGLSFSPTEEFIVLAYRDLALFRRAVR